MRHKIGAQKAKRFVVGIVSVPWNKTRDWRVKTTQNVNKKLKVSNPFARKAKNSTVSSLPPD
jgi:hypothetical protein